MESEDLAEKEIQEELQVIRIDTSVLGEGAEYTKKEASTYRSLVNNFFENHTIADILDEQEIMMDLQAMEVIEREEAMNEQPQGAPFPEDWCETPAELTKIRDIHSAVREICRQFWGSFPPVTTEMENKLERMATTIQKYKEETLLKNDTIDPRNLEHCIQMVNMALQKYQSYGQKTKK